LVQQEPFTMSSFVRLCLTGIAACMMGPCIHHTMGMNHLAARVADLGTPFDSAPMVWALLVCLTETVGTLLIVLRIAPRTGAVILIPKMAVATYGHAFVPGFDAKFQESYAGAWTPAGLSYNWAVGASWECGVLGAGYFLVAYSMIALSTGERMRTSATKVA